MKFVADVMLGRLARLMRFAGYDVEYDRAAQDDALVIRSRYRVLLSRDRRLVGRIRAGRAYFVEAVGGEKQLAEIRARFPIPTNSPPRCLVCNHAIRRVAPHRVRHLVPPYVYETRREFFRCAGCRRVYWKGTHFEQMSRPAE
jgi:hypothetical protein